MVDLSKYTAEDWLLAVVFIMVLILIIRIRELKKDVTIYVTLVNTLLWICIGLITLKTRAVERDNMNKMYKCMGKTFGRETQDDEHNDSAARDLIDDSQGGMRERFVGDGERLAFNKNAEYFNNNVKSNPQVFSKDAMHRVNKIRGDLGALDQLRTPFTQKSGFATSGDSNNTLRDCYEDYAHTYTNPNTCTPNVKPYRAFRQYNREDTSLADSCAARSGGCGGAPTNPIALTSTSYLEDPNREFYNGYDAPISRRPAANSQRPENDPYELTRVRDMGLRHLRPDLFPNSYGNSCARDGMSVGTSGMFDTSGNSAADRAVRYNRAQADWRTKSNYDAKKSRNPNNMKKYWEKELGETYARDWWQQQE